MSSIFAFSLGFIIGAQVVPKTALLEFDKEPVSEFVAEGKRLAENKKPAYTTAFPFQKVLSRWWNGKTYRPIEFVWWFSPEYVSLRLGYLARKEGWKEGEISKRWRQIRQDRKGKLSFIVQLAAAPKVDILSGEKAWETDTKDLENVHFVLIVGKEIFHPTKAEIVHARRTREEYLLSRFPWHQFAPGGNLLREETEEPLPSALPIGEYYLHLFIVEFSTKELQKIWNESSNLVLEIRSRGKERTAVFSLRLTIGTYNTGN
ncbi:MAG TPA: hypothetical protein VNK96_02660 [Fimbriimonadales bacterium]|nr:hypothetical protein [Fimbriimonadales bacterium]